MQLGSAAGSDASSNLHKHVTLWVFMCTCQAISRCQSYAVVFDVIANSEHDARVQAEAEVAAEVQSSAAAQQSEHAQRQAVTSDAKKALIDQFVKRRVRCPAASSSNPSEGRACSCMELRGISPHRVHTLFQHSLHSLFCSRLQECRLSFQ